MAKTHKIKFEIGDWSDDGHGKCRTHYVKSNKPVDDVREAYFAAVKATGIDLGEYICHDYEDSTLDEEKYKTLEKLGYKFQQPLIEGEDYYLNGTEEYMDILLWFLSKGNSKLKLKLVEEEADTFHFYGFDKKKRHIPHLGYGLFT